VLIIDGNALAAQREKILIGRSQQLKTKNSNTPNTTDTKATEIAGLAIGMVGENPSSQTYVRLKQEKGQQLGLTVTVEHFTTNQYKGGELHQWIPAGLCRGGGILVPGSAVCAGSERSSESAGGAAAGDGGSSRQRVKSIGSW